MTRLLFCWELGANFGHLSTIAAMRPALEAAGFELAFAVADLKAARQMLGEGARIYQAPVWPRYAYQGGRVGLASFADVLTLVGFGDADNLAAVTDAWLALFALADPQVLIADHSPAAQIAANVAHLKLVTIGTGFTLPPLEFPEFPPLRADIAPAIPERQLLKTTNAVLARHGTASPVQTLPALFRADARIVVGLPELDPYRSFRREGIMAPPGGFPAIGPAEPIRLFAYLGAELPQLESRVQSLCDLPIPVELYIRGANPMLLEFIRLREKTPHATPASMGEVLGRCTHVLSQGGAMMASMALAAGRPHLMLPLHDETRLNASLVTRFAAGIEADAHADAAQFIAVLRRFLADQDLEERARNAGSLLAARPLPDSGVEMLKALKTLTSTR